MVIFSSDLVSTALLCAGGSGKKRLAALSNPSVAGWLDNAVLSISTDKPRKDFRGGWKIPGGSLVVEFDFVVGLDLR